MSIQASREQRRQLERDNAKLPKRLQIVPQEQWPLRVPQGVLRVWRSRDFLVQEYAVPDGAVARLSVCRTSLSGGRWQDGIAWEELQEIKQQTGYGDSYAVEIFPGDADVVNVANMRHLWVLAAPPAFAWRAA